eukprot:scaffold39856_cov26-Prasinocladus_malaysianus.AAC.1
MNCNGMEWPCSGVFDCCESFGADVVPSVSLVSVMAGTWLSFARPLPRQPDRGIMPLRLTGLTLPSSRGSTKSTLTPRAAQ